MKFPLTCQIELSFKCQAKIKKESTHLPIYGNNFITSRWHPMLLMLPNQLTDTNSVNGKDRSQNLAETLTQSEEKIGILKTS